MTKSQTAYLRMLETDHQQLEVQNQSLRKSQVELETSRDHFAELFETAPICFVTLTRAGTIREINASATRLLGRRNRFSGWPFASFIAKTDKKIFLNHLKRCRENSDPTRALSVELHLDRPARENPLLIELVSLPVVEKETGGAVFKCVFRDITEMRQMSEVHRWLAAIVESTEDAVIGKDLTGKIISCNRGASNLFGYAATELVGQPVTILFPPELKDEEAKILERIRRGEQIDHYETVRRRKDGTLIEVSLTISPIRDLSGKVIGASKIARDITDRRQAERELKESLDREKAANRAKDEFLAALSHELRTPLNPVLLLASEAARNHDLPPQTRADFDTIRKNVELEARLIDDLLDLTRVIHGKLILSWNELDAHAVFRDAASTVLNDAEQKQIVLTFDLRAPRHDVFGDAVRLQQVFWNVLKNAVKFTPPEGKIFTETDTVGDRLVIKVTDSGIGMTSEETLKVFNAFSQGSHHFGGLGLGLAITRALVELHLGTIRAESAGKGQGATFIIELPLVKVAKKTEKSVLRPIIRSRATTAPEKSRAHALRILLVEDHEPTRTALTQLLLRRQFKVSPAGSLAEARRLVANQKEKFNLLISDIGLPDGEGYDLMTEMRRDSKVKGIALTGYGMEQDVNRSHEAGFATHLIKPVRVESLDQALVIAMQE